MKSFIAYPGQVWSVCYAALSWLQTLLQDTATQPSAWVTPAETVYATLRNGATAVAVWQTSAALRAEIANLTELQALPIQLDQSSTAYMVGRSNGIIAAANGLDTLLPLIRFAGISATLSTGKPAIPDPGFIEWCLNFTGEVPPSGLIGGKNPGTRIVGYSQQAALSWQNVVNAVSILQGTNLTGAYDTASRAQRTSRFQANMLASCISTFNDTNAYTLWNGVVALPSILNLASLIYSAPYTLINQQCGVIRYALRTSAAAIARFLLSLRRPQQTNVQIDTLLSGETLMDFAARTMGDFEQWRAVAALNGLVPPYPGPTNPALAGRRLLVPQPGGAITPGAPLPTYDINILGTDLDFGPINGSMPAWSGDYNVITGLANYARALGRRLQTPLGDLLYHQDYGCRIPLELGAIQGETEAERLNAFGIAALLADPRTGQVLTASASVSGQSLGTFTGSVIPIGPGATPVNLNETISPLP